MNLRFAGLLLSLVAAVALGACQTINEKRKIDYKTTRTLPPLEIPPDLAAPDGTQGPGPTGAGPAPSTATYSEFVADPAHRKPAAGGDAILPEFDSVRVERSGQIRWLSVKASPEQLWPRVREFILNRGLIVDKENPQTGVLETDWAENRANVGTGLQKVLHKSLGTLYSTGTRDKYRFRLERGSVPGTTEVYISHRGMEEVIVANETAGVGETRWQPRASDPGLEAEMLRLLMVNLGVKEDRAGTLVASLGSETAPERARLERQGEQVRLSVMEDFERAWRRVGLALDRSSFTVEDRDRSKGVYYVRYIDPDTAPKKKGFFARMFSGKEKQAPRNEYQVALKESGSVTRVVVLNQDGTPESSTTGNRILTLLYDQLK